MGLYKHILVINACRKISYTFERKSSELSVKIALTGGYLFRGSLQA